MGVQQSSRNADGCGRLTNSSDYRLEYEKSVATLYELINSLHLTHTRVGL